MKKLGQSGYLGFAVIVMLLLLANGLTLAEGSVVRLHVLANSDTPDDQAIKESVRDYVVDTLGPQLAQLSPDQVEAFILANRDYIAYLAGKALLQAGSDLSVQVEYGIENYPTRLYGNSLWPSGRYRSLRILLGEGQGRNWWCLLFPPLCFAGEVARENQQEGGIAHTLKDGSGQMQEVRVRFWLWDKLAGLFKGRGGKQR
jgi:stage II sporulation protein R